MPRSAYLLRNKNKIGKWNVVDAISSVLSVDFGVAQGNIVGPLIFIVFMNDIINSCSLAKFVLYADDTIFFMSS